MASRVLCGYAKEGTVCVGFFFLFVCFYFVSFLEKGYFLDTIRRTLCGYGHGGNVWV